MAAQRGGHGHDVKVGPPQLVETVGERNRGARQLSRRHFQRAVDAALQFCNPVGIDVKADARRPLPKSNGHRQANIAQPDDRNFALMHVY